MVAAGFQMHLAKPIDIDRLRDAIVELVKVSLEPKTPRGSVFGILFAPAFFWIPGIGPIPAGGIIGSVLMGMVEGAAVGAAIGGGTSVLIASGTVADVERARTILAQFGGQVNVHER